MRQVIKHREIRPLKMIRRTDPVIPLFRLAPSTAIFSGFLMSASSILEKIL